MRVLHINKFGWLKGGSESSMLRTCERLAELPGFDVGVWAERPEVSGSITAYSARIPSFHELRGPSAKAAAAMNVVWSRQAARDLDSVLDEFRPDVAHLHLYAHQFSSSILSLLHRRGIATVATAHEYKFICPAYVAVRNGEDCFACAHKLSSTLIKDACLHGSRTWSSVAFAEAALVRRMKLLPRIVVAPSRYMEDRLADSWLSNSTELRLIRHPQEPSGVDWVGGGDYLLFVGRLSAEKGTDQLISIVKELGNAPRLVVAGDGPERARLEQLAGTENKIEFVGHLDQRELAELRRHCIAQIVPSNWPEVVGLAALEAAVDGVPVITTARGGLPELFELGGRGAALSSLSADALAAALRDIGGIDASSDIERLRGLRDAVSWDAHLSLLVSTYEDAIGGAVQRDDVRVGAPSVASGVGGQVA